MIQRKKVIDFLKSKVITSFGLYTASTFINSLVPFLLLPVFTKYLSKSDYGLVSMFSVLCSFITPFLGFSTFSIVSIQYFKASENEFSKYLVNIFYILAISLLPVSIVLFFFSGILESYFSIPFTIIVYAVLFSFCTVILNMVLLLWQIQSKAIEYGGFQVISMFFNLTLSLFFVMCLNMGWNGRVLAQLITVGIFSTFGLFVLNNNWTIVTFQINFKIIKDCLKYGIPLIPHTLGAVMMSLSDRFFMSNIIGLEAVGIYSVGYSIGSIIGFLENSFNLSFSPWLYERLSFHNNRTNLSIVKFFYVYFFLLICAVLMLTFFVPLIFKYFINEKFVDAQKYVFWIALSFAFGGMYKMVVAPIFFMKKTWILSIITFTNALFTIILNYFLINKYGAIGAAISACIVSFLFFIFTWILSNYVYALPWIAGIKIRR